MVHFIVHWMHLLTDLWSILCNYTCWVLVFKLIELASLYLSSVSLIFFNMILAFRLNILIICIKFISWSMILLPTLQFYIWRRFLIVILLWFILWTVFLHMLLPFKIFLLALLKVSFLLLDQTFIVDYFAIEVCLWQTLHHFSVSFLCRFTIKRVFFVFAQLLQLPFFLEFWVNVKLIQNTFGFAVTFPNVLLNWMNFASFMLEPFLDGQFLLIKLLLRYLALLKLLIKLFQLFFLFVLKDFKSIFQSWLNCLQIHELDILIVFLWLIFVFKWPNLFLENLLLFAFQSIFLQVWFLVV